MNAVAVTGDGTSAGKLELSDDSSPIGSTANGSGIYGKWSKQDGETGNFPFSEHKGALLPSTLVLLPRDIQSATPSPDGKRFAVVADPRPVASLEDVRHVIEAGESSSYIVNTDGTGGSWWCSGLK